MNPIKLDSGATLPAYFSSSSRDNFWRIDSDDFIVGNATSDTASEFQVTASDDGLLRILTKDKAREFLMEGARITVVETGHGTPFKLVQAGESDGWALCELVPYQAPDYIDGIPLARGDEGYIGLAGAADQGTKFIWHLDL